MSIGDIIETVCGYAFIVMIILSLPIVIYDKKRINKEFREGWEKAFAPFKEKDE